MKKIKAVLLLVCIVFLFSGCMAYNHNITINKDGSGSINFDFLVSEFVLKNTEEDVFASFSKMGDENFDVTDITRNGMMGKRIKKDFKDIYELIELNKDITNNSNKQIIDITYKKGFFANVLTIKGKFTLQEIFGDDFFNTDELEGMTEEMKNTFMNQMDFKFTVNVPYASKSNAATISDDKLLHEWKFDLSGKTKTNVDLKVNFPNYKNIIMAGVGAVIVLAIAAGSILVMLRKKKVKAASEVPSEFYYPNANEGPASGGYAINTTETNYDTFTYTGSYSGTFDRSYSPDNETESEESGTAPGEAETSDTGTSTNGSETAGISGENTEAGEMPGDGDQEK